MKRNNEGYTLVELIVVFVMLAIIVGITIGGLYMYTSSARLSTDVHNASDMEKSFGAISTDDAVYTMIRNGYKEVGKGGVITIKWKDETSLDKANWNFDAKGQNVALYNAIDKLLTGNLPESQTRKGFTLMIKMGISDNDNVVTDVECAIGDKTYTHVDDNSWKSFNLSSLKEEYN